MAILKIKQVRSRINCPKDQKKTLDTLGLTKMNKIVEHEDSPVVRGLINKVHHLVTIVE